MIIALIVNQSDRVIS